MFSLLDDYVKNHKESFVGHNVIDDLMKLVRKNSKIQAVDGQHDDSIMSFLMCLYLYYYGNNLARYGFSRGKVPDEEERNLGMNYTEIVGMLNENERAALGISEESHPSQPIEIDMFSMISEKRGLISKEELNSEMNSAIGKKIKQPTMDPYTAKVYKEMLQAQKESEAFNKRVGFANGYKNLSESMDEDEDDLSWFEELL